ncbi:MAG: metallophosphoesterase [Candidatus Solibacter usitatus]|nr:metallophosphoesterase [Candidatus Solibacter usitatus]
MSSFPRNSIIKWLVAVIFAGCFFLRTLPSQTSSRNDFHFAIIGDRTGDAQPQIFGRVWREVDLMHPDFVLNVGDTIQGGGDAAAEKQWAELRPLWKRYSHYPLYFTAGNHDIFSKASEELYVKETGRQPFYSFDYQDAHFTILDNSRVRDMSEEQLAFLEKDLKANRNKNPKIVVFHKDYWIGLLRGGNNDFPLHKIVRDNGVKHVISGHGHNFVRIVRDGVAYMEVGSSGGGMKGKFLRGAGFKEGCFYHHVWARVQGGEVKFTVKELDGQFGKGRMFAAEDWDEKGPHFDISDPSIDGKPQT